jgi:multidrug resistance efflux pump
MWRAFAVRMNGLARRLAIGAFVGAAGACGPSEPLPYVGFVDAPVSAVATQVAGKVDAIAVKEDERVRKGQLLARLESGTYEAALAQAEANLDRAKEARSCCSSRRSR